MFCNAVAILLYLPSDGQTTSRQLGWGRHFYFGPLCDPLHPGTAGGGVVTADRPGFPPKSPFRIRDDRAGFWDRYVGFMAWLLASSPAADNVGVVFGGWG